MKWEFEVDVPKDVKAIVVPHLDQWGFLIPTWCQQFLIRFDPGRDSLCSVNLSHKGRWAVLVITGHWLEATNSVREVAVIHELLHINLEPLTMAGHQVTEILEEGSSVKVIATGMLHEGMEAAVQDLAYAMKRGIS